MTETATSDPVIPFDLEHLTLSTKEAKAIGARLAPQYQGKHPFDHICVDNFLPMQIIEHPVKS